MDQTEPSHYDVVIEGASSLEKAELILGDGCVMVSIAHYKSSFIFTCRVLAGGSAFCVVIYYNGLRVEQELERRTECSVEEQWVVKPNHQIQAFLLEEGD